ncbi:MAG: sulfur carrier protein ThiS [Lachnospiraceae bacterium]|nr:sulfur carrier protein ThiS [Lachnospiraceae bacterium]
MKIIVSGEVKEVKDNLTIAELIELEKVETPQYVSVSVNDEFAKSENFATDKLHEGDVVEFLYFMGGGSNGIF